MRLWLIHADPSLRDALAAVMPRAAWTLREPAFLKKAAGQQGSAMRGRILEALLALPSEVLKVGFIQHNMDDAEQQFAHTNAREVVSILVTKLTEETRKLVQPGYLEVVYHLFSMAKKHGPIVLRMRTENRSDKVELPSFTPVWRSALATDE